MAKNKTARLAAQINEYGEVWQLHQNIGRLAEHLDRIPDTAAIKKRKLKTAPLNVATMVF